MSNQLLKGRSFSPGDTVDAADLNNLVDLAIALGPLVSAQPSVSAATGDSIIISDVSDSGNLKKALVSSLPGAGTVTSVSTVIDSGSAVLNFSVGSPTTTPVFHLGLDNQGPGKVLIGPVSGAATTPTFRVLTPADLPSATVQNISASTIDCTLGNVFNKTLTVASNTFHLTNGDSGQVIKVRVQQTPAGTATLAWVADTGSIRWPSGTAPVLTTGGGRIDMFEFVCMGGNAFYGIRWGKDML
jgi:hypothetical protein